MKNLLFKTLTVLLLTLSVISRSHYNASIPYSNGLEIKPCSLAGKGAPFDEEDDNPCRR